MNARPRSASGAPRWTSSALQTTAAPLPDAARRRRRRRRPRRSARRAAATDPDRHQPDASAVDGGSPRRSSHARREIGADHGRPMPRAAHISPKPKSPASNDAVGEHDLGDVDGGVREHRHVPGDEHGQQRPRADGRARKPSLRSRQCPRLAAGRLLEQRAAGSGAASTAETQEADRVDPVGRVDARSRRRARRRAACRAPTSGCRRSAAASSRAAGRRPGRGSAARRRRPAGRSRWRCRRRPRARRSAPALVVNGSSDEDAEAHEVGADHQPLPREPVDERPDAGGRSRPPAGSRRSAAPRPSSPESRRGPRRRPSSATTASQVPEPRDRAWRGRGAGSSARDRRSGAGCRAGGRPTAVGR